MSDWFKRWWNAVWTQEGHELKIGWIGCRQPLCKAVCHPDELEKSGWWSSSAIDPVTGKKCGQVHLCPKHRDEAQQNGGES